MDELDLLGRFRVEAPEDDADARSAARAALLQTISRAGEARRVRRRVVRRRWAVAAGATVAAVVVAIAAPALIPGGREASAAAETLRRAARAAAVQPHVPVGPGEFVYTQTRAMWQGTYCGVAEAGSGSSWSATDGTECETRFEDVDREIWIGPDGAGRIAQTRAGERWDETFGPGELWFEDLAGLPTDVDQLRAVIEERASQSDNPLGYEIFVVVGDLLRETNPSPELRAALYEVAATIPGIELLGEVTDESGRPGVGVAMSAFGVRHELIFDPATSAILGERDVQVDPPVTDASPAPGVGVNADGVDDPGTVIGWSVVLASGVVDSVRERP